MNVDSVVVLEVECMYGGCALSGLYSRIERGDNFQTCTNTFQIKHSLLRKLKGIENE